MATKTVLSLDQFRAFPDQEEDGTRYELSEGELVKLPPAGFRHGALIMRIGSLLYTALTGNEYIIVAGDTGFLLDSNPEGATVRGADIAVNRRDSAGGDLPVGWFPGPPLLAIEVVSPGNTARDLQLKVKQYLHAGTLEVWLVYPDTKTIYVYSAQRRDPQVLEEADTLESIVGRSFPVADFFRI